jgi:hypothetical protein
MAEATSAPRGGTLNVILHGTRVYMLDEGVTIIIPDIANYTMVAGTFLHEQPLVKGARYSLKGVNKPSGPAARISTGANMFLTGVSLVPNAAVFCELDLLVPADFRSVRCMDVQEAWFKSPHPTLQVGYQLALVHVLSYDFDDAASVAVVDQAGARFPWEPKFDQATKTVNLHIYSDPQAGAPPETLPAFTELMNLFGQNVQLDPDAVGPFVPPPDVYPEIRGLESPLELQDYNTSRPEHAATEPPYSCVPLGGTGGGSPSKALVAGGTASATGALGFSISVKGEVD